ncbi:hypothetical protein HNP84_008307 [Thermocatellispora tengchongensis]|uniref:DUF4386 domain-containing protein n=1 Tax=Thermocatellispora tengchongensis TaxID=1073253 RepID=A0A840PKT8_9ACTN|nr:hypothetical protein [Thermocatellispora tengchongensis]MBB5138553.1 hypothetical protein [Thermocatellispora tengchongensis]
MAPLTVPAGTTTSAGVTGSTDSTGFTGFTARAGAFAFGAAGVLFLLYQATRPYSDETTMAGAVALSSGAWIAAHLAACAAYVLFAAGLMALRRMTPGRAGPAAVVAGWAGVGLTLPYYGAETFGLHAIAQRAVRDGDASLIELFDQVRYVPAAIATFAAGLLLLGAAAVLAAVALHRSGMPQRWSGLPLAIGFALLLPQFFGTPAIRIAHGALVALGGLWIAITLWRAARTR